MTKMPDTGLWSAVISLKKPGAYTLIIEAIDGAKNKTTRTLKHVYASPQPQIISRANGEAVNASAVVYYLEPESGSWTVWDGASYGQDNPQKTDPLGNFKLFLPEGKYYIEATAKGYKNLTTDIFEIKQAKPFSSVLEMEENLALEIGRLELSGPAWTTTKVDTEFSEELPPKFGESKLFGQALPAFSLTNTNGQKVNEVQLLSRPTVLSFITTWTPDASRQLDALAALQANKDVNVIPIALQEKTGKITAFSAISGQEITWLVDSDSSLSSSLEASSVPMHYFVDRRGNIQLITYGFMDKQSIQNTLGSL
jgi:peroxiredoxin